MKLPDTEESLDFQEYHRGHQSRPAAIKPEHRFFIGWDGEGVNLKGPGKPQSYVLFGCSTGDCLISDGTSGLKTKDLLQFIIKVGRENPGAFHVGFAFGYDSNMIVKGLPEQSIRRLYDTGKLSLRYGETRFHIQYTPGKWFSVTQYNPGYHRSRNSHAKTTVRIYDTFSFFNSSFLVAYKSIMGREAPESVVMGKSLRDSFGNIDRIKSYWWDEIRCLAEMVEQLRSMLYGAGLRVTKWYGPGALASYALRQNRIHDHMAECPKEVRDAAKYAYAGGRFEMFKVGRITGPVYSYDINSAYPSAISRLPSLSGGVWRHVENPTKLARFAIYKVDLHVRYDHGFDFRIGPLFHRDGRGNISFPWKLSGWYWSPEVQAMRVRLPNGAYTISEGWEYLSDGHLPLYRPFEWVGEMYERRKQWKREGNGSQLALKLCLNSLYGKMAQRVGWDEENGRAPQWHQLEWAGWVTSYTRASLYELAATIPQDKLIAIETDGLYTTVPPSELGIESSDALGGWEIDEYDEILYMQSGLAWLRKNDEWIAKRRGLDATSLSQEACEGYLKTLMPSAQWAPYIGRTTRFIGMGAAFNSSAPFRVRHCVWETTTREIKPGQDGKRFHAHKQCRACANGASAYEMAHDLHIKSKAYIQPESFPHHIPWEEIDDYPWRHRKEVERHEHARL